MFSITTTVPTIEYNDGINIKPCNTVCYFMFFVFFFYVEIEIFAIVFEAEQPLKVECPVSNTLNMRNNFRCFTLTACIE